MHVEETDVLKLKPDLQPWEKILAVLSLVFFPPALLAFLTWEKGKGDRKTSIFCWSVLFTWLFILFTGGARISLNAASNVPMAMPRFWYWVHSATRPFFDVFGYWLGYAVIFAGFLILFSLLSRVIPNRS